MSQRAEEDARVLLEEVRILVADENRRADEETRMKAEIAELEEAIKRAEEEMMAHWWSRRHRADQEAQQRAYQHKKQAAQH